jgi:hypothetical protein
MEFTVRILIQTDAQNRFLSRSAVDGNVLVHSRTGRPIGSVHHNQENSGDNFSRKQYHPD